MELQRLGPYRLDRILGSGGMGTVYAGVDDETKHEVAIKVLSRVLGNNPAFRDRFSAEIETLKKLHHPHIVELFGYGEQDGQLFYSMELVNGRSLQDELQSGIRFDWSDVSRIAIQVCQALKHAHDRGVIHRDLKPANLMWSAEKLIKLSDFGIAKLFGGNHITAVGSVIGTADYMAPEQAESKNVTHQSDLYSLGSVMFALLARRPPFLGTSVAEVLHALKYDPPPPIKRFAPATPEPLQEIIHQLLQKDPALRVANAYVLSNQLRAMEYGLTSPTRIEGSDSDLDVDDSSEELSDVTQHDENASMQRTVEHEVSDIDAGDGNADGTPTRFVQDQASDGGLLTGNGDDRFTSIDDEQRLPPAPTSAPLPPDYGAWMKISLGLLAIGVFSFLGWRSSQPDTADELFQRIEAAVDDGRVSASSSDIEDFLERFPDDERTTTVRQHLDHIELDRYRQRLTREARRAGGAETLVPAELAYLDALRWEHEASDRTEQKLHALIQFFQLDPESDPPGDDKATGRCISMARKKLQQLRASARHWRQQIQHEIQQRLQFAEQIENENPEKARQILQAIVRLYGDQPWASPQIETARQRLARLPSAQ